MVCMVDYGKDDDITVVCTTGAIALTGGVFSSTSDSYTLIANVRCDGLESNLLDCSLAYSSNCPTLENAAVFCQGNRNNSHVHY